MEFYITKQKRRYNEDPDNGRAGGDKDSLRISFRKRKNIACENIGSAKDRKQNGFGKAYAEKGQGDDYNGGNGSSSAKAHCPSGIAFNYSKKFHSRSSSESWISSSSSSRSSKGRVEITSKHWSCIQREVEVLRVYPQPLFAAQ